MCSTMESLKSRIFTIIITVFFFVCTILIPTGNESHLSQVAQGIPIPSFTEGCMQRNNDDNKTLTVSNRTNNSSVSLTQLCSYQNSGQQCPAVSSMHRPLYPLPLQTRKGHPRQATSQRRILSYAVAATVFCLFNVVIFYSFFSTKNTSVVDYRANTPPIPMSEDKMLIVVAPTFYADMDDIRYHLGLDACREAAKHEVSLLLVDASPSNQVAEGLEKAGRTTDGRNFVRVVPQTWKGKKGVALREGIAKAAEELKDNKDAIIAFQELEKVAMFQHYQNLVDHFRQSGSQIVVPRRSDQSFKSTYPIEQYHSENFANMLLDSIGSEIGMPSIDWTIGPVLLKSDQVQYWLQYHGETWDAQLVPVVDAHIKGSKVSSFEIDYDHPKEMKEQEQGQAGWNEKRLYQINVLTDTVGKRMKEEAEKRTTTKR